jgi:hypothetical protein
MNYKKDLLLSALEEYGYLNGDKWDELCKKCYRLKYSNVYYDIPAILGGDSGIEGYTSSGVVHQCYCPERDYSDKEANEHYIKKLTTDIGKLLKNGNRLKAFGVGCISEWHFNIPYYTDNRLVVHMNSKTKEVVEAKNREPNKYDYIADNFRISLVTADSLLMEINKVLNVTISDFRAKFDLADDDDFPDGEFVKANLQKADEDTDLNFFKTIHKKMKILTNIDDDNDDSIESLVRGFCRDLVVGRTILSSFTYTYPDIGASINVLNRSLKREISYLTKAISDKSMNKALFTEVFIRYQAALEDNFSKVMTNDSIINLKHHLIAGLLADCSMYFRS